MLKCFRIEEAAVIVFSKKYPRIEVDNPEQADGEDLEGEDDRGDDRVEQSCVSQCGLRQCFWRLDVPMQERFVKTGTKVPH